MPKASQKFRKKQKVASAILTATMIANSTAFTFANEVEQPKEQEQIVQEQVQEEQAPSTEEVEEEAPVEEVPVEEEAPATEEVEVKEETQVGEEATDKEDVKDESAEVSYLNSLVTTLKGTSDIDTFEHTLKTFEDELRDPYYYISDETKATYEKMAEEFNAVKEEFEYIKTLVVQLNSDDIEQVNHVTNVILQSAEKLTEGLQGYFKNIIEKDGLTDYQVAEMQYVDTLIPQIENLTDADELNRVIGVGEEVLADAKIPERFTKKYKEIFAANKLTEAQLEDISYLNSLIPQIENLMDTDELNRVIGVGEKALANAKLPERFAKKYKEIFAANKLTDKQLEDISYLNSLIPQIENLMDTDELNRVIGVGEEALANAKLPERFAKKYKEIFAANKLTEAQLEDISFLNSLIPQIENLMDADELNRVIGVGEEVLANANLPERFAKKYEEIFAANKLTDKQLEDISFLNSLIPQIENLTDADELNRVIGVGMETLANANLPERFVNYYTQLFSENKLTDEQLSDISFLNSLIPQIENLTDGFELNRVISVGEETLANAKLPERFNAYYQAIFDANKLTQEQLAEISYLNSLIPQIENLMDTDELNRVIGVGEEALANANLPERFAKKYKEIFAANKLTEAQLSDISFLNSLIPQIENLMDADELNRVIGVGEEVLDNAKLPERFVKKYEEIFAANKLTDKQLEDISFLNSLIPQIENLTDADELNRVIGVGMETLANAKLPERFVNYYTQLFGENKLTDEQLAEISYLNSLVPQIENLTDGFELNRVIGVAEEALANAKLPERFNAYYQAIFDANRLTLEQVFDISFLNSLLPQIENLTDGYELNRVIGVGEETLAKLVESGVPVRFQQYFKQIFDANRLTDKQCEDISFISSVIEQMKVQDDYRELRRLENVVIDALKEAVDVNKLPERFVTHLQSELDKVKLTQEQFEDASFVQSIIDQLYA